MDSMNEMMQNYGSTAKLLSDHELLNQVFTFSPSLISSELVPWYFTFSPLSLLLVMQQSSKEQTTVK